MMHMMLKTLRMDSSCLGDKTKHKNKYKRILNSLVQEVNAAEADLNVLKSTKGKKKQKKRSAASELMSKTRSNLTTLWQKTLLKPETI